MGVWETVRCPSDCIESKLGAGCRAQPRGWQTRKTQGDTESHSQGRRAPYRGRKTIKCCRDIQEDEEVTCFHDHAAADFKTVGRQMWDCRGSRNAGSPWGTIL